MFETLGFEDYTAKQVSVWFALSLGIAFGILAQLTAFCLRRALVGDDRRQAAGVWLMALATALVGTQAAVTAGLISFDEHRFMASELPWLAISIGGLAFGAGMVLTRGCISRLTVLTGSGNLRALTVVIVFALVAHATLKGVLAPLRTGLGSVTASLGDMTSLAALPGGAWVWTAILVALSLAVVLRSGNRVLTLVGASLIGLLAVAGWIGTGYVLYDEFEPIAVESLSFTSPAAETLFYGVASTAIEPGFGTGLLGGVVLGALVAALLSGKFKWQSFETPAQTGRYLAGAMLMGFGGVLAGGCTVGAGLSGVPTLSFAALLALVAIAIGGLVTNAFVSEASASDAGSSATQRLQPAE
ncbi:YeeE/YedE family protein [Aliishimia ponticola]|uniref:YeeE/YedE family protein n=1 Tax=Aliishimia ponticola TaxID=2499833 RepID=A0A4S4NJC9_9RHOB|nr:YeeE/YedE family protein [Aliishimia ponticola]THH39015.1 YeeE/YedE family protein [Aliishimia ponticola]